MNQKYPNNKDLTEATLENLHKEFSDILVDIINSIIEMDFTKGDREVGHLAKPLLQLYKKSSDKNIDKLPEALKIYKSYYYKKQLSKFKYPSINQYDSIQEFIDDIQLTVDPNPIIFDDGEWMIRELNSKNACINYTPEEKYGWCTGRTGGTFYDSAYNKDHGNIYLISKNDKVHSQLFVSKDKNRVEWMYSGNTQIEDYDEDFKGTIMLKWLYDKKILIPFEGIRFRGRKFKYTKDGDVFVFENLNLSDLRLGGLLDFKDEALGGTDYKVVGSFYCDYNKLKSLEGAPENISGDFYCSYNQLTSLKGAPKSVGGSFLCNFNQLTSLKEAPENISGDFYCNYNKLKSLEGAPENISGDFYCSYNQLTSLKGAPKSVGGSFLCNSNKLKSLEGAPKKIHRSFVYYGNPTLPQKEIDKYLKSVFKESKLQEIAPIASDEAPEVEEAPIASDEAPEVEEAPEAVTSSSVSSKDIKSRQDVIDLMKDVEAGKAGAIDKLTDLVGKGRVVEYGKGGFKDLNITGAKWKEALQSVHIAYDDIKATTVNGKNLWVWQGQSIAVATQYDPVTGESVNQRGAEARTKEIETWTDRAGNISIFGADDAKGKMTKKSQYPTAFSDFVRVVKGSASPPVSYTDIPLIPIVQSLEVMNQEVIPIFKNDLKFSSWWADLKKDPKYPAWVQQVSSLSKQYLGADVADTFMSPVSLRLGYYKGQTAGQYVYKFATAKGLTWVKGKNDATAKAELKASKLHESLFSARQKYDSADSLKHLDPTKTFKYIEWICKVVEEEKIDPTEISFIVNQWDILLNKNQIPKESRDINQLTFGDVQDILETLKDVETKTQQKKQQQIRVRGDSEVVFENDDWMVVVPYTEKASNYYGQGTKWCISATQSENTFMTYTNQYKAFFYFVLSKTSNEKYAFAMKNDVLLEVRNVRNEYLFASGSQQALEMAEQQYSDSGYVVEPDSRFDEIFQTIIFWVHDNFFDAFRDKLEAEAKRRVSTRTEYYGSQPEEVILNIPRSVFGELTPEQKRRLWEGKRLDKLKRLKLTEATLENLHKEFSDILVDIINSIIEMDFTKGDREVGHLAKPLLQLYKKSSDKNIDKLPEALKIYKSYYYKKQLSKFKYPSINQYDSIQEFIDDIQLTVDPNPIIFDDGEWMIRELNSKNACLNYAPEEKYGWCTGRTGGTFYEDSYNKDEGNIYLIYRNDKIHSQLFVSTNKNRVEWMYTGNDPAEDYDEDFKNTSILKYFYNKKILIPFEGIKFRGRKFKYTKKDEVYVFTGYLDLSDLRLESLLEFKNEALGGANYEVFGMFDCIGNRLITLEGSPIEVRGDFYCSYNKLKSLEGAPKKIHGSFVYYGNSDLPLKDVTAYLQNMGKRLNGTNESLSTARKVFGDRADEYKELDPTDSFKYLDWICKVIDGGEEPEKVKDTISLWHTQLEKNQIPKDKRDINHLSYSEVLKILSGIGQSKSQQKHDWKDRGKEAIDTVFENDDWYVVVPKTEEASKFYGFGTRWCTSGDKKNEFNYYSLQAHRLHYIIPKDETKEKLSVDYWYAPDSEKTDSKGRVCTLADDTQVEFSYIMELTDKAIPESIFRSFTRTEKIQMFVATLRAMGEHTPDGYVYKQDLKIAGIQLRRLPFKIKSVLGLLDCRSNLLESFVNFPREVNKLWISDNPNLKSLEGAPDHVDVRIEAKGTGISDEDWEAYAKKVGSYGVNL